MKPLAILVFGLLPLSQAVAATNLNVAYAGVSSAQKLDLYVPTTTNGPLPLIMTTCI